MILPRSASKRIGCISFSPRLPASIAKRYPFSLRTRSLAPFGAGVNTTAGVSPSSINDETGTFKAPAIFTSVATGGTVLPVSILLSKLRVKPLASASCCNVQPSRRRVRRMRGPMVMRLPPGWVAA